MASLNSGVAKRNVSFETGYTLIELVMVLVIISILAVVGMSLFANKSDYAVYVAKQQIIASLLLAQQAALATQDASRPIDLAIVQSADAWTVSVVKGGSTPETLHSQLIERAGATLTTDGALLMGIYTLRFDQQANLVPRSSHVLQLTGGLTATICVSSSGYGYESSNGVCP